jgi:hypothetical protein
MLQEITYHLIFGIPFIVYLGIITLSMFFMTAMLALLKRRGKTRLSIHWHFRLAYISITLGIVHGILGVLAYF